MVCVLDKKYYTVYFIRNIKFGKVYEKTVNYNTVLQ